MLRRFAIIATLGLASALRPTPTHLASAHSQPALSRRALLPALAAAATVRPSPALAADALEQHTTGSYQVTFGAPAGWPVSEQELQGSRYLYIATDPAEPDSANVVLTFQPLAADYTSLGSFGTQQLVGNSLMPQCADRSGGGCTLEGYGIEGKMLGTDKINALTQMSLLKPPAGRFERIPARDGITAIVDYAHTPDALENVLKTIAHVRTGGEKVITVVGCGGDRDAAKRPVMASSATSGSDRVILTSDNPRSEDPAAILKDMEQGLDPIEKRKCLSIVDRREAIRTAAALAEPGDIVLVAGKGHETYQEIQGERHPFDDRLELKEAFAPTT